MALSQQRVSSSRTFRLGGDSGLTRQIPRESPKSGNSLSTRIEIQDRKGEVKMARRKESRTGQLSTRGKISCDSEPQLLHEEVSASKILWKYVSRRILKKESTTSGARESKLLRGCGRDLILEKPD